MLTKKGLTSTTKVVEKRINENTDQLAGSGDATVVNQLGKLERPALTSGE